MSGFSLQVKAAISKALLLAIVIVAFGTSAEGVRANAQQREIIVMDELEREVKVRLPVRTIVSIAPSNTEILFALGLGDRVVGVTEACDYPPEAGSKPKVGHVEMNMEKIVGISPDLVVAVGSMQLPAIETLSGLGIPVVALDPKTLRGVLDSIVLMGRITGTEDKASLLVERLNDEIQGIQLQAAEAVMKEGRPRVFVEIWDDPLMTAGPGTFIDELIRMAGGENVSGDAGMEWPEFSVEAVVQRDPDVIVTVWTDREDVLRRPAWNGLSACRTGRVYKMNPDILTRPGPRLVEGLRDLLKIIHPGR